MKEIPFAPEYLCNHTNFDEIAPPSFLWHWRSVWQAGRPVGKRRLSRTKTLGEGRSGSQRLTQLNEGLQLPFFDCDLIVLRLIETTLGFQ